MKIVSDCVTRRVGCAKALVLRRQVRDVVAEAHYSTARSGILYDTANDIMLNGEKPYTSAAVYIPYGDSPYQAIRRKVLLQASQENVLLSTRSTMLTAKGRRTGMT